MNVKFLTLTLQCRKTREVINFSPQVSYFHGQISTGKSSIARLIDFCLGGSLEMTPAITQELVSVQLSAHMGEYDVLFEREAKGSNQVQVTWRNAEGVSGSVLAPIQASSSRGPIWGEKIFNLSDLLFHFLGLSPLKVRRSQRDRDSELVRLSFRDIMWYCYLEQGDLDSSFFQLEKPVIQVKSRHVMRFIVGAYTERLNELEIELSRIRELMSKRKEAANQFRRFLEQFGYSSESQVINEIERTTRDLAKVNSELSQIRQGHVKDTHFADDIRDKLRQLNKQLAIEEQALVDVSRKIEEQESLKAELLTAKFKLARSKSAKEVLSGLFFEFCPACGMKIDSARELQEDICPLCGQHPSEHKEQNSFKEEIVRRDLDSRVIELNESLERHTGALVIQERTLANLREEKILLDNQLEEELRNYDSKFLASSRDIERRIATFKERIRGLRRILEMPKAVAKLEDEADRLRADEESLRREIRREKDSLEAADRHVHEIEESFLQSLIAVGVPGVRLEDRVRINRTTWVPEILTGGKEDVKWDFHNAGSAGKKTLFKVCYALSIHKVAAERGLSLPTFLIIDTPMKNIGEDVNRDIFESFYNHLYELAQGPLRNTQFIVIDKEFFPSTLEEIVIKERYMTKEDDMYPPLITYYRGP